jgi:tRNA(Ile)-lysidine synthase
MLITTINQFVTQHALVAPHQTIIVGFSGGPDSLFLLHYLRSIQASYHLTLIAAHLDHEWRADSVNDRLFCERYCKDNNIQLVSCGASSLAIDLPKTGSKEEMGRVLRRTFFQRVKKQFDADTIALAHHLDDQLETFFIRLLRGASITGLGSMRPRHGEYIRPLLCARKHAILNYLAQQNITYVIDPTNTSQNYLRNRVRHALVPALEQIDKRYFNSIVHVIAHVQDTDIFLQKLAHNTLGACTGIDKSLSLKKFLALDLFLQKQVLIQWLCAHQVIFVLSTRFIDEILRFFSNTKSTTHHFNTWAITKKYGFATIIHHTHQTKDYAKQELDPEPTPAD